MTHIHQRASQSGSALVAAAMSAGVLSILIAGVLVYLTNEARLNTRSHIYAQALNLAEAGLEITMGELNNQYCIGGPSVGLVAARGWSNPSLGTYIKAIASYTNAQGTVVGSINITISGLIKGVNSPNPQILSVGTCPGSGGMPSVTRSLRAILKGSTLFPTMFVARRLSMVGNANIDSFDSEDPTKSTGGLYDVAKRQTNGDAFVTDNGTQSISYGNAIQYGKARTGPTGNIVFGSNGRMGPSLVPAQQVNSQAAALAQGYLSRDFSIDFPEVTLPNEVATAPNIPSINNVNTTITSGDYVINFISLGNRTLTLDGEIRLLVRQYLSLSGTGTIIMTPNSKVTIYADGPLTLGGGGIQNQSGNSLNLKCMALPGCTSVSIGGGSTWIGVVYAPNADIGISGNGQISGSLIGRDVSMNGNAALHYDEALARANTAQNFIIASWMEL